MSDTPRRGGRPAAGEPVLDRAFRLLDAFSLDNPRLTLTELAERSGLPLSTALRLAQRLSRLGALERISDGTFAIGIRMLEYAALAPRGHGLRAVALPYMEDLHRATQQHVQLAVREEDTGVIIERLSAPGAGEVLYYAGSRIPLHGTAAGIVLLAHARPEFQDAYLRRDLALEGPEQAPDATVLRPLLRQARTHGVVRFARTHPAPASSVAAPILDRSGACIAAIAVLGADGTVDMRMAEAAVVAISRAISRDLGRGRPAAV